MEGEPCPSEGQSLGETPQVRVATVEGTPGRSTPPHGTNEDLGHQSIPAPETDIQRSNADNTRERNGTPLDTDKADAGVKVCDETNTAENTLTENSFLQGNRLVDSNHDLSSAHAEYSTIKDVPTEVEIIEHNTSKKEEGEHGEVVGCEKETHSNKETNTSSTDIEIQKRREKTQDPRQDPAVLRETSEDMDATDMTDEVTRHGTVVPPEKLSENGSPKTTSTVDKMVEIFQMKTPDEQADSDAEKESGLPSESDDDSSFMVKSDGEISSDEEDLIHDISPVEQPSMVKMDGQPKEKDLVLDKEVALYFNDQLCNQIVQSLKQQREKGEFCDVTVVAGSKKFLAHRAVLAANSAFLHSYFSGDHGRELELKDISEDVFDFIIDYLYTGQLAFSLFHMDELMSVCDYLGIENIKQCCTIHLQKATDITNWFYAKELAQRHKLEDMEPFLIGYLNENFSLVATTPEMLALPIDWLTQILSDCNPQEASEVEMYKLDLALKWVAKELETRKQSLPGLLEMIRVACCPKPAVKGIIRGLSLQNQTILKEQPVVDFMNRVRAYHKEEKDRRKEAYRKEKEQRRLKRKLEKESGKLENLVEEAVGDRNENDSDVNSAIGAVELIDKPESGRNTPVTVSETGGMPEDPTESPARRSRRPRKAQVPKKFYQHEEESESPHEMEPVEEIVLKAPPTTGEEVPVAAKRKRGRPKGSKNKKTLGLYPPKRVGQPTGRPRGRPRKMRTSGSQTLAQLDVAVMMGKDPEEAVAEVVGGAEENEESDIENEDEDYVPVQKRKRGRPRTIDGMCTFIY